MQIGELSKRTGVSVRMLRYYEQEGLVTPVRSTGGYRNYNSGDEQIINAIQLLNKAGLKLDFIRRFLPCLQSKGPVLHPCPELMDAMSKEMSALDERIKQYKESRELLENHYKEMCEHA